MKLLESYFQKKFVSRSFKVIKGQESQKKDQISNFLIFSVFLTLSDLDRPQKYFSWHCEVNSFIFTFNFPTFRDFEIWPLNLWRGLF